MGKSLEGYDAILYVESWLRQKNYSASDQIKAPIISSIKNSMEINNIMNDFYYKQYQLASSFKHKYCWVILAIKGDTGY